MRLLKNQFKFFVVYCLSFSCAMAFADDGMPKLEVRQIPLSASNAYLIKSKLMVLVDSGGKQDLEALKKALATEGVSMGALGAVILTHGHADHAGLVAELKRHGVMVVAGTGDTTMTAAGHNDDIKPTNFMARLLKRCAIDPRYEAFTADVQIVEPFDLHRFGIAGKAIQMPGHTPGSLVIVLEDGRAFVGDMMLGGWMGGAMFADKAGEHYFQDNLELNHANIIEMLNQPIHTFYLGHGGPVTRASVLKGFHLSDPRAPDSPPSAVTH